MSLKQKKANQFCTRNQTALMVFSSLLIIYLLTFNGQFTSIDELNLYAITESIVQTGETAVPQVAFAAYHNPVGTHEATFPLIATPLYWLAQQSDALNNIYMVMLLNPILVATTSLFIFLINKRLGHSSTGSAIAAYAYGLGSLAWPYALTFYREPLVGFLWAAGLYGLVLWRTSGNSWGRGFGILAILLSPLVKVNILFSIPFLFLIAQKGELRWKKRATVVWGASFVALLGIFQLLYQWRTGNGWEYANIFANFNLVQILLRVYGQLFSPIKGLIFYMPIILLVAPGLYYLKKKHLSAAIGITLTFLSLLGATSFYGAWYGGESWGPRLLLPVLPVIMIPLAALWDHFRQRRIAILIPVLLIISSIMQLPVVTNNWWKGFLPFRQLSPTPESSVGLSYRNLALSPPWVLLKNWRAADLNLLWLQTDRAGAWHIQIQIGILLFVCLLSVIIIWKTKAVQKYYFLMLVPLLLAVVVLQRAGGDISVGYTGLSKETAQNIAAQAQINKEDPYTLVTMSNEFHIYFYEGFLKGDFVHHWISPNQPDGFETVLENNKGNLLAFVADRVHVEPENPGKELEWWLNKQFYRFDSQVLNGYELIHYGIISPTNSWERQAAQVKFGSFQFQELALSATELFPNDVLGVQFELCKLGEMPDNHKIFVHLLADGEIVEGVDGAVRYGEIDVDQWQTGECIIENRGIYIPPTATAGRYELIVGVYTPDGSINSTNSAGEPVTYQPLAKVNILASNAK